MDTMLTATRQLMDYIERMLRQRIAEIPAGATAAPGHPCTRHGARRTLRESANVQHPSGGVSAFESPEIQPMDSLRPRLQS